MFDAVSQALEAPAALETVAVVQGLQEIINETTARIRGRGEPVRLPLELIPQHIQPTSAESVVLWSSVIAGTGVGLSTPALIRVSTESIAEGRAGLGAGVYKTMNELGAVFGVLLLGGLLEARIVKNALRGLPGQFLPDEVLLKSVTSLKTLEEHALRKGLPIDDLAAFHAALLKAVRHGFDQAFGVAVLLAVVGVAAALLLPKRLEKR